MIIHEIIHNPKYVYIEDLKDYLNRQIRAFEPCPDKYDAAVGIYNGLYQIPAADVVPVRHGRWKPLTMSTDNGMEVLWVHAKCGCERYEKSNYCPNCGALMDKDGDA